MDRVQKITPDRSTPDADAYVRTLREHAGDGPIGVTGYCMGARLAVRAAGQFPGTVGGGGWRSTAVAWSPTPTTARTGRSPHSTAEYVFGHADKDRSMTLEKVAALEETLQAAGRPHLNEIYEDAAHGYSMDDTSMYHEAGAERHFRELEGLLASTLRG